MMRTSWIWGYIKMKFKGTKPVAQSWLGYLVTLISVLMFAGLGVGGYFVYKKDYWIGGIALAVAVVLFLVLWYCNNHFAWVQGGEFTVFDKKVVYTYSEVVDLMGNNKFKYTIKSVSSMKRKGRDLVIKGDIVEKIPLRKSKNKKKCRIYDITDEAQKYLEDKIAQYNFGNV